MSIILFLLFWFLLHLYLLPLKKFLVEIMKRLKVLTKQEEIRLLFLLLLLSLFFVCFTASVIPLINTFYSFNNFKILIIPFIFSFEINKVNTFSALTRFPLIFLANLLIAFEGKLPTNPGKLSLAKEIATFVSPLFLD